MKRAPASKKKASPAQSGSTVQLSSSEERQVQKRAGIRAEVVFETVRREGEAELERSALGLGFSGLAAGLSMGFSLVATGLLRALLPDATWRPLVENLGYTVGFLIVVLGRQQLFTENTVTAILPLLDDPRPAMFLKVARLWAIVLAANLVGAAIFAYIAAHSPVFPQNLKAAFLEIGMKNVADPFWTVALRGVFSGWMIALMVWLLPAADTEKVTVIVIITYLVGALGLTHIIAGSVDVFYAVADGSVPLAQYFGGFLVPVFIGNTVGGVLLVSLLNYGQVAPDSENK